VKLDIVFRQGLWIVGIGLALGLAVSFEAARLLQSMITVSPADPRNLRRRLRRAGRHRDDSLLRPGAAGHAGGPDAGPAPGVKAVAALK
jgi:hypothetical protein